MELLFDVRLSRLIASRVTPMFHLVEDVPNCDRGSRTEIASILNGQQHRLIPEDVVGSKNWLAKVHGIGNSNLSGPFGSILTWLREIPYHPCLSNFLFDPGFEMHRADVVFQDRRVPV